MVWNYGDSSDEEERTDRFKSERSVQKGDNTSAKHLDSFRTSNDKESKDKFRDRRKNDVRRKRSRSRSSHRKLDERDRRDSRDRNRHDSHDKISHDSRDRSRHESRDKLRHEVHDSYKYDSYDSRRSSDRHGIGDRDRFREDSRLTSRHESYSKQDLAILGNEPVLRWSRERSSLEYYNNSELSSSKSKEEKHSKHSRDKKNCEIKQSNSRKRSASSERRPSSETKHSKHHTSSGSPKSKISTTKSTSDRSHRKTETVESSKSRSEEPKVSLTSESSPEKVVKIKKCKRKAKLKEKEDNKEALKQEKMKNENSLAESKVPSKPVVTKKANPQLSVKVSPKKAESKNSVSGHDQPKKAVSETTKKPVLSTASKKVATENTESSKKDLSVGTTKKPQNTETKAQITDSSKKSENTDGSKKVESVDGHKKSQSDAAKKPPSDTTKKSQSVDSSKKSVPSVDSNKKPLPQSTNAPKKTPIKSLPQREDIKTDSKSTNLEGETNSDDASTFLCKETPETGDTKVERVYGPSLPVRPSVDPAESYGPALPPSMSSQSDSPEGSPRCDPSPLSQGQRDGSPESDDGVYGPVLPGTALDPAQIALQHRAALLQMHHAQEGDSGKEKVEREEWMTKLPERGQAVGLGLTARTFRARDSDAQRDESWTDTPEEKERKQRLAQAGVVESSKKKVKEPDVMVKQRDEAMEKMAKKHKKDRSKSLLDMHQDKIKKQSKQKDVKPERRPFSRETDLNVNQLSDAQKKSIYKKAAALDSRFSSGQAKYL